MKKMYTPPTKDQSLASLKAWEEAENRANTSDWDKYEELEAMEEEAKRLRKAIIPHIGMHCTMFYYSDSRASTVVDILSDTKIVCRHNQTKCLDFYAGNYEILQELEGGEYVFTKRKNGVWCLEGQPSRDGVLLSLTCWHHYIDPQF